MNRENAYDHAIEAFCETIKLKLKLFQTIIPKGSNSTLVGGYIEELVRGFVANWIRPCELLQGTLHPRYSDLDDQDNDVSQIEGIVFDPRTGPPIIRQGNFVIANPFFCPGIIEIKKSCARLQQFEERLKRLHRVYYVRGGYRLVTKPSVMGIVAYDSDPKEHSHPDWIAPEESLHQIVYGEHCPIFILFKEIDAGVDYEPYKPAIEAMIRTVFSHGWALGDWKSHLALPRLLGDQ
jgi:hypothetical protein